MMKKLLTLSLLLNLYSVLHAQDIEYYLNNKLRFVDANNDTIPYPFTGGFIAPQFSEIDLNNDGVKDLFVFDRNGHRKLCFLNEGIPGKVSYVYAPQYEHYFPVMYNWALLRDYNCDGKEDLFTSSESAGFGYTVYKNVSTPDSLKFELVVPELMDKDGSHLSAMAIDIPLLGDMDNDGDMDILAFGSSGAIIEMYRNERVELGLPCDTLVFKTVDYCWGNLSEGNMSDTIFLNQAYCRSLKFYKSARHVGSTLLNIDVDEDGDMDILIGDVESPTVKLIINGKSDYSWPWDTAISYQPKYPAAQPVKIENFPATYYVDINNDGIKDLIATSNEPLAGRNTGQIWYYKNKKKNNNPDFEFVDSVFLQNMTLDFGSQSVPTFMDTDGDGDMDLLLSHRGNWRDTKNSNDRFAHFENIGDTDRAIFKFTTDDYLGFSNDSIVSMYPCAADMDGDGLPDLIIGKVNGKLSYYRNTGSASNPSFTLVNDSFGSIDIGTTSAPTVYDFNTDGLPDLLVGRLDGYLSLFLNKGSANAPYFFPTPDVDSFGRVKVNDFFYKIEDWDSLGNPIDSTKEFENDGNAAPVVGDLDNDGSPELICGNTGGKIFIYSINMSNFRDSFPSVKGYFIQPNGSGTEADLGSRTAPALLDADGDGRPDIFIGNSRGGLMYLNSNYTDPDTVNSIAPLPPLPELLMYPNPARESVTLHTADGLSGRAQVEVYDLYGRLVMRSEWEMGSDKVLSLSGFSAGNYFVTVKHPDYRGQTLKLTHLP